MKARTSQTSRLRPRFVEILPEFDKIREGEIWISMEHGTINLRCPCGCGSLTVLTLDPSRWQLYFDGEDITIEGNPTSSIWTTAECGSHYFIREGKVEWATPIQSFRRRKYRASETARLVAAKRTGIGRASRLLARTVYWWRRLGKVTMKWLGIILIAVALVIYVVTRA